MQPCLRTLAGWAAHALGAAIAGRPGEPDRPLPGSDRLFARLVAPGTLERAWHKVRRNAGAPGGDRVEIATFALATPQGLRHLACALRSGDHRPGPLRRVTVPKPRGGVRVLAIPCVVDRIAQTAAAELLSELVDPTFHAASFAYRPGRSVADAIARVEGLRRAGCRWAVDADIDAFFDTVPHRVVRSRLVARVADRRFLDLVMSWLAAAAPSGHGLPQGSPLSPVLANLVLDPLDRALDRPSVRPVRYADDILLLCRGPLAAAMARVRLAALLAQCGLRANRDKTRVVPLRRGVVFLGYELDHRGARPRSPHAEPADAGHARRSG